MNDDKITYSDETKKAIRLSLKNVTFSLVESKMPFEEFKIFAKAIEKELLSLEG